VNDPVVLVGVAALAFAVGVALGTLRHRRRVRAAENAADAERRAAEDRLRASEGARERMDAVLSSMREGVLLFGEDGEIRYANPAAERHLGAVPRSIAQLLPLPIREATAHASGRREPGSADAEVGSPSRSTTWAPCS
jgi:PAS domain-containing protein